MNPLPRAPTFPALPADIQEVEEVPIGDYKTNHPRASPLQKRYVKGSSPSSARKPPADPARTRAMDERPNSSTSASSGVPVVPLRVAKGRSRMKEILLWRDLKTSGMLFGIGMVFFYFTLYRGQSMLAVFGGFMTMYLIVGSIVVNVNKVTGGKLDKYIKRPAVVEPVFKKDAVNWWMETIMDEGNDMVGYFRDLMYCDHPKLSGMWIGISLVLYIVGKYFSIIPIMFAVFLLSFSLPLIYEKNQKDLDAKLAKIADMAEKHFEKTREISMKQANKYRDLAANKMETGPLAVRGLADKIRATPVKPKKSD